MPLQLNNVVEQYKEFYGSPIDQMPLLLAEGRTPMSVSDIFQQRVNVLNTPVQNAWWDNYFFTGDMIAYHPDGEFKVVRGNDAVYKLFQPDANVNSGGLTLSEEAYYAFDGPKFSRRQVRDYVGKNQSLKGAKANPLLQALGVSGEAIDATFGQLSTRYHRDEGMTLWLADVPKKPAVRSWVVYLLGDDSVVLGYCDVDGDLGRLAGVAPEAHVVVSKQTAEGATQHSCVRKESGLLCGRADTQSALGLDTIRTVASDYLGRKDLEGFLADLAKFVPH